ncbi:hypothetical protein BJV82DRAFT_57723 [Fennellomyces sp. T-0311]|nr:hypothetical protein BJV82DRAFT_57723 [Fennellomyces sp. T-0311]
MTTQLQESNALQDDRSMYKADGILRCKDPKNGHNMELALLETSKAYDAASPTKFNYDFHKGMYGSVAMLKTIADRFRYASFKVFSRLKLYFLHAHTEHIRLWSISCPEPRVFLMMREDKCTVPVDSNDDPKVLLDYIGFSWTFKERLENTLKVLSDLEKSNSKVMAEMAYDDLPEDRDLSCLVKPHIVKVTERLHAPYFTHDGPYSLPSNHSNSQPAPW